MNIMCKGNMLKAVITRIDYDDLYELEKSTLKKLKKISIEHGLTINMTRELNAEEDFELNDPTILRELPNEYIKTCMCNSYFNEKLDFIVEINQFFIRIIQKVNRLTYTNYEDNHLLILLNFINEIKSEELIIRRVSIKKVDEANFKDLKIMEQYFKPEIVQQNIFGLNVNWNIPSSGASTVQNLQYKNKNINFYKKIDRVSVRERFEDRVLDNIYYKIYLEYEVYNRRIEETCDIEKSLIEINSITRELFLNSFTGKGRSVIEKGGVIGDYESNE
ncbi:hypothetical protein [Clostridium tagluense]|uniref:hypothetical protein n=1 Tax=Clostridium tagluense TaxID=360422 RepID=UPI001C0E6D3F|nr:hypothetical protein [Clostridium tagluense]MBU3126230.1 hypothetical protein [Clostridium tagluense]